ncbi:MAG TPA: bifunctional UDP-N-acetylglucosamine diphosphorylase/glucosamine-1-phosphate N-acetyltransferase GlmU [Actinomycetota bacterium]|nr:bifunctional UDP-N-acetylglucosamine diphosphorylase/glucosamine-1-phosphate N-acetyltransferase GlmU [Actinomycetota bacterium]
MAETTTRKPRSLALVVLAAGKGKRLKSGTPKVLHPVCGRPALWHVLQAGLAAKPTKVIVVVGHGANDVRSEVASWRISPRPVFVEQTRQLGTGHAVRAAERAVGRTDDVLVMGGDFDPVTGDDVKRLVASHRRSTAAATIASTVLDDPGGYGRVVRRGSRLVEVVEDVDATPEIRSIREVSIVLFAFRRRELFAALPLLDRRNRQREYYLNRVIPEMLAAGRKVNAVSVDTGGAMGLNSRAGLAAVEAVVRGRINAGHMANGVTLVDPGATYIDVDVEIGPDSVIYPNTFLERGSLVGVACGIGPSVAMASSTVGDGSVVRFSVLEGARVGAGCEVGPFARLRDGAVLDDGVQVGNYVEVKATTLGHGAKAKHLTYLGDAEIGEGANIGAGTVTVNYDGYAKHTTKVGSGARIGSDTMLVAPVRVGRDANTGAGSVITKDVPDGALGVERAEQRNVEGYRKRKDEEHRRRSGRRTKKPAKRKA